MKSWLTFWTGLHGFPELLLRSVSALASSRMLDTQSAAASWSTWSSEPIMWISGCGRTQNKGYSWQLQQIPKASFFWSGLIHLWISIQHTIKNCVTTSAHHPCLLPAAWVYGDSLKLLWYMSLFVSMCSRVCVFKCFQTVPQQRAYSCMHICFCKFVQMKVVFDIKNLSMNHTTQLPFRRSKGQIVSDY